MSPKLKSFPKLNHNVRVVLFFTFMQSLGRGIWMGNVLSSFIYLLSDSSPELLGLTSAATGVTMTIIVFPSGYLADRLRRRDWMLRVAAIFGLISVGILFFANNITMIFVALIIWGLYQGITRPSLEAIFADSVPTGNRSILYSWRQLFGQIGMAIAPFLNIILFLIFGDEWDLSILKLVMIVGLIFSIISLVSMFFFSDKTSLEEPIEDPKEAPNESFSFTPKLGSNQNLHPLNKEASALTKNKRRIIPTKYVPYVLVGCNIIIGLGAGMTVKFFPVFFMEEYALSPINVQIIFGLTSIATGLSGLLAQKLSRGSGRPQIIFLSQAIATVCLGIIATYPPLWILIVIFILRGSFMNAAQPLSRSILMDIVPKNKRGIWNSLEALAWGLFWNVSAVVGGYLIGPANNFRLNFLVTTGIYVVGTLPIILLFKSVAHEK
ncbi:MAG: MFS transporter [Promethearchaeota archaeon]